ncbi:MAG: polyprenyl diphosphate synthase [Candidatus Palauibacterales bacterium]|nr:polyprenyl diphosphate synthase [Candidatus Palauibacterales bacterium]MDP2530532.1 polyprenyl diphosphate synthase [Candidatus Palauibacterales bacterium]MDP2582909.1 polyprenyl diphosphate synthase [Candidatus Palauibacterales bacterium]
MRAGTSAVESAAQLLAAVRAGGGPPTHVAVIMDGNGRWAYEHGLARWEGHREGMAAVRETVEGALEAGLAHLTLYAFSSENWSRPEEEVAALMDLLQEFVDSEKEDLRRNGVRVRVFGELDRLSESARAAVRDLEGHTREVGRMQLHLAISYGSRQEIVAALRTLAAEVARGELRPDAIDEERVAGALYTSEWPDPDLLIRTSGEMRISNFLLWQIAYAEIHVTDVLWPDFGRADLFRAILDFQGRERRFGGV